MYKAKKMLLLIIQRLFSVDEVAYYNTRELNNMKQVNIRTTLKSNCISICGVKLWNSLQMDLRNSTTWPRFKKEYKQIKACYGIMIYQISYLSVICLSVCLSVNLSICLSVCPSVHPS